MVAGTDLADLYRAQVEAVVKAVVITSATRYEWFGVRSPQLPRHIQRALTHRAARGYLLYQLQAQLYHDFYCAGGATPPRATPARIATARLAPFIARLQAANAGQGCDEPGWQVLAVENDTVVINRDGLALWVSVTDCVAVQAEPAPATATSLRLPKDLLSISPGFYMAVSDTPLRLAPSEYLVRLYWNVTAEGAVLLVGRTTQRLNTAGVPFKLKVVDDPDGFRRCDAAVLYIRSADYAQVAAILSPIYEELRPHLRPAVPALTKPLAPGLGLAEDPGPGESFGLNRCLLLADGLLLAQEHGAHPLPTRMQRVMTHFRDAGISCATPFLRPGSADEYPFEWRPSPDGPAGLPHCAPVIAAPNTAAFLETARAIGQRLVDSAMWAGDQCNWIGATFAEAGSAENGPVVYQALGPDLYAGTSGVALFLAELYAVTGDQAVGGTARAAIQQALTYANRIPSAARLGFYTGWVGLAFAAVRSGRLLNEGGFLAQATQLLHALPRSQPVQNYDLLSGSAGAINGLLVLAKILQERSLEQFAAQLGTELITAADKQNQGYSWPSLLGKKRPHLTGLSHGAAGIGSALLELYAATGEVQYRTAGEAAYAYEQTWFDPGEGNWPDFRFAPTRRGRSHRSTFATYWCHGAPGVALTRLRAYELLGDPRYAEQAEEARQTTKRAVQDMLAAQLPDFSLCHGVSGNAEVLLRCTQVLPHALPSARELVDAVAYTGIERYGTTRQSWPGGVGGVQTPGLMLGLAGTGLFYLRLHHPATPSVLWIQNGIW